MSRRVVRAVLDSSAVVAYAHGRISVGEVLVEITDGGAGFALPDTCVIDAAAALDADRWIELEVLMNHSHCVQLNLASDWRDMATATRVLGSMSAAQAMLAAVDHGAYLLTRRPHLYGEDAAPIIEV